MKTTVLNIVFILFACLLTSLNASETIEKKSNNQKNNIKIGAGFPRLGMIEYERKLPFGFSAYGNYGISSVDIESISSDIKGFASGVRYKLPIVKYLRKIPFLGPLGSLFVIDYVGLSYASLDIDYNYIQTTAVGDIGLNSNVNVNAALSGPMIELGKDYQLGSILIALNISYLQATPDITATVLNLPVSSADVNKGAATIEGIPNITLQIGYAF